VRTRLLVLLAGLVAALALAAPATALTTTSVDEIVEGLLQDQVFLADDAQVPLDEGAVQDVVRGSEVQVYVAGVSAETAEAAGGDASLVQDIGASIGDPSAVVLVITDARSFYADNGRAVGARGVNAGEAARSVGRGDFDEAGLTAFVQSFVSEIDAQAAGGGSSGSSGGGSGALLPVLALGAAGGGAYLFATSRRRKKAQGRELEDLRADVESLYGRLGSDVQLLAPGDDDVARQALADAAERYNATGALMARADTPGEFAAARRTAVEGLTAARVVRQRLGLDPGPEVPVPPGSGPQLTEPARVQVGEQEHEGSPTYTPGRPHYFEGGYYEGRPVPGGWYATPFWQTLLMGSMLGGRGYGRSYGGGVMGGGISGYGGGYGRGGRRGSGLGGLLGGAGGRRRSRGGGFGGFGGGGSWGGGGGGRRRGGGGGW
jgi:hypothetical protein